MKIKISDLLQEVQKGNAVIICRRGAEDFTDITQERPAPGPIDLEKILTVTLGKRIYDAQVCKDMLHYDTAIENGIWYRCLLEVNEMDDDNLLEIYK